jgi:hypothetical protein
MKAPVLQRKIKKWGMSGVGEEARTVKKSEE